MIKYILTILLTLCLTFCFGQTYDDNYGQPIIVLIESNPWLMVIGSDVPTFALYENGQIIYRKVVDNRYKYFEVKNDKEKTQAIIKSFGITGSLMVQADYVEASSWTDQPKNIMLLDFDTFRQIVVYGNLQNIENEARSKTPQDFLTVYDNIRNFEDQSAMEWFPDTIEVMATRYSHSPDIPLQWNSSWSDISSSSTVQRNEDLYSIYLNKKYFNDFLKLLDSVKEKQAVEINGKKYSLTYRLPFPNLR